MPLVLKDRVKETSTTAGTGALTLAGAVAGYQSFSVIGNGNTTYYTIVDPTANTWEVGIGTYTASGTSLSRDTILESSSGGSAVSFASNAKDVFVTYPAERAVATDFAQTLTNKTINGANNTLSVRLANDVTGTLPVGNGGTGATTLTGVLKGNGGSAFTAATAGTDFVAPGTATTFTATQTFSGTSSALAMILNDAAEVATVSATAATGTIAYDITTQSVLYYTSNASANWTVTFRASAGTTLNTALATGQSVTVAFLVTQGATAYYNSAVRVDGSIVTPKWQGGTAPTAGNASGIDVYVYTIIKTGSAAFTVLAALTRFA